MRRPRPWRAIPLVHHDGGGVVDLGPLQRGLVDGRAAVGRADARREVREQRGLVVARPAVPLHVDDVAGADGGVRGDGGARDVAGDVGVGVGGGGDVAVVEVGGGPGDAGGGVGLGGARVEAVIEGAVDEDVGEVGVGEGGGGRGEGGEEEGGARHGCGLVVREWWLVRGAGGLGLM